MNKGFFKFIFKLIILVILILGIFAIIARNFGMYIYDEEYASYKQTMDYVNNESNDYNSVLIFGDSVAKAGVIPQVISEDTYNISMAGATTIEQYYIMKNYLEHHEAPKTLIMMYFIGANDSIDDFFWNRTLYFNCLTTAQFNEIVANGAFENYRPVEKENGVEIERDEASYKFYEKGNFGAKINFWQYKLASPTKYYAAIKNAMFEKRYEVNQKEYETSQENKGQHYFGTEASFEPNNVTITGKQHFEVLPIIDIYMNKCIELCKENGIQVIIEQHPINESTYANMSGDYKKEYMDYMKSLKEKHPEIIVNTEYNVCPSDWLGDFSHLNENGATKFSEELKEKYSDYLK